MLIIVKRSSESSIVRVLLLCPFLTYFAHLVVIPSSVLCIIADSDSYWFDVHTI